MILNKWVTKRIQFQTFADMAYFYLLLTMTSSNILSSANRGNVLPVMGYFFKWLAIYICRRLFLLVGHDSSEPFQKLKIWFYQTSW